VDHCWRQLRSITTLNAKIPTAEASGIQMHPRSIQSSPCRSPSQWRGFTVAESVLLKEWVFLVLRRVAEPNRAGISCGESSKRGHIRRTARHSSARLCAAQGKGCETRARSRGFTCGRRPRVAGQINCVWRDDGALRVAWKVGFRVGCGPEKKKMPCGWHLFVVPL
jgi:hypothetical protein